MTRNRVEVPNPSQARVIGLRLKGLTYKQIGHRIGLTPVRANQLYRCNRLRVYVHRREEQLTLLEEYPESLRKEIEEKNAND
jgi:hypothetical protein